MNHVEWLGESNTLGADIWAKKYQYDGESFEEWLDRVSAGDEELKQLIREKKFLMGGRTMANRGVPDEKASYFNCYSRGYIEDDYQKIMEAGTEIGLTFKSQGGQGVSLSKLRPKDSPIGKRYKSDGIVPFMKIYNEITAGTSQAGCIHEDELVLTQNGYKRIKDIQIGDNVYTKVGYVPVNIVYDKGKQKVYRVTTSKGYTIRTTIDHKFCVDGFQTKHLSELNVGDKINLITGEYEYTKLDKMAYVAAHFLANGSFTKECDCGYITISDKYRNIADLIENCITSMGYDVKEKNRTDENVIRIVITAEFGRALKNYGVKKINASEMEIPNAVMFSNDTNTISSFIAGCIDSDGSVVGTQIKYTTICENYAKQLHLLMSRAGFFPSISVTHEDYPRHDLYEIRDTIRKNTSGFFSLKANEKGVKPASNSRYTTPYTIENAELNTSDAEHLKKIGKKDNIGLYTYLESSNKPYAPMIFDSIVSVEDLGEAHVYDIGLEKEHLFFCNGFYVSNSRKGALMISIDARHKEAETFIHIKSTEGEIEKANLSLEIDDEFMNAVKTYYETGEVITLHEKRNYSGHIVEYDVVPIEIFKSLSQNAWDWGDPAVLYTNRFRNYNIMEFDDEYVIETSNPCGEQPLPKHGCCCLSSLNMSEFVKNPYTKKAYLDTEELVKAVRIGIRTLDRLIDENANRHPLKEQQEMSLNYRNVGLGVFGYATALMKLGLTYGSEKAIEFTDTIFSLIFKAAVIKSNELAKELGPFPKYSDVVWDSKIIRKHFRQDEIDAMKEYGLRNCSLISIAPTGSIATMLGESGGCEPEFAISFTRRTVGMSDGEDKYYKVFCKAANDYMQINHVDEEELPECFVSSSDIKWIDRVKTQAVMQEHVDTAISSTVNLPQEATVEDVEGIYYQAWLAGLKGITIFRSGCKRMPILSTEPEKTQEEKPAVELKRGEIFSVSNELIGKKRKLITGCGSMHIHCDYDPNTGELREVFIESGSNGGCERNLAAISRMISVALRGGIAVDDVIDQLSSVKPCVSYVSRRLTKHDVSAGTSCPSAIAEAIKEMNAEMLEEFQNKTLSYGGEKATVSAEIKNQISQESSSTQVCPECGAEVVFEGGCCVCKQCGWSKCG